MDLSNKQSLGAETSFIIPGFLRRFKDVALELVSDV